MRLIAAIRTIATRATIQRVSVPTLGL
jgi:hypothetical protein